jgi:N-acetyl-gamma-glutamyl-phosphate reductase
MKTAYVLSAPLAGTGHRSTANTRPVSECLPRSHIVAVSASASVPTRVRVAILGASGYTGVELLRLLAQHPRADISALTAERSAGLAMGDVFGQFAFGPLKERLPRLIKHEEVEDWAEIADVVFCCLPHATTQDIIASLPLDAGLKVIDLSADFRLRDVDMYAKWYGGEHRAKSLQKEAVYGLSELYRDEVRNARLIANPGCYPTAAQLPLVPLLRQQLILPDDIIIDAKSGVTGAGRAAKVSSLFCEVADGISAYGVASHRHAPEIEQGLGDAIGSVAPPVAFTPHLIPMSRGILETIYVRLAPGKTPDHIRDALAEQYQGEPFVHVLPAEAAPPQTRHVRGSNNCVMSVIADRIPGRAIIVSVLDNIVKGASGQAIQNMNIVMGFPEVEGLEQSPVFP